MKKIKDRFSNKKGFTLVELIVVIVIILILAAALVPNVMRYIDEARKASFKSDASSYLVEVQGAAAECFAKYEEDVTSDAFTVSGQTMADGTSFSRELSGGATATVQTLASGMTLKAIDGTKKIEMVVSDGAVTHFTYVDTQHIIHWTQAHGWYEVDDTSF